jgi:WD40 repeat protein
MKFAFSLFFVMSSTVLLTSCDDDDNKPKGQYEHGAFIINEGAFGASNGSVTFLNLTSFEPDQNIFRASGLEFAGDVIQSYTVSGDRGYLVNNDDGKIEVVDANTFASIFTITAPEIDKPRYVQVVGDKAYISVWGPYDENYLLVDSYVVVYDLSTRAVVKKIDTDEGVEDLIYNGKYIFASCFNFGGSNSIAVIDPTTDQLVDEIEVTPGPAGMVFDANDDLWVISTGNYFDVNGNLIRINPSTLQVEDEISLEGFPGTDLGITADGHNLVYHVNASVYNLAIHETAAPSAPLFTVENTQPYSLSLNPFNNDIYLGDPLDYASPGVVHVYGIDGVFKQSIPVGINPTQVVFK